MSITVNGHTFDPGCYIDGHRGQYGPDELAPLVESVGLAIDDLDDPRYWRACADAADAGDTENMHYEGNRAFDAGLCWENHHWAADQLEELLNRHTEGGYWTWQDGEFFLIQTEVTSVLWVPVPEDEPALTYDEMWRRLCEFGISGGALSYDDLDTGQRAYRFRITVHYEPE